MEVRLGVAEQALANGQIEFTNHMSRMRKRLSYVLIRLCGEIFTLSQWSGTGFNIFRRKSSMSLTTGRERRDVQWADVPRLTFKVIIGNSRHCRMLKHFSPTLQARRRC